MGAALGGPSAPPTPGDFDSATVNVRVKIAALWASMLFVFVCVDLFSTYRADFRADLDAGKVNGFTVDQTFLLATTAFVVIPSLMVFLTLVLPPRVDRIANLALSGMYALMIIGGAVGEWNYYLLGSAIEVVQLAGVGYYAWTWPRRDGAVLIEHTGVRASERIAERRHRRVRASAGRFVRVARRRPPRVEANNASG
jgi:hypothetical protein